MNLSATNSPISNAANERRHDLDALRAFAMLLGIVLHGAMAFIPGISVVWPVEDPGASPLFGLLLSAIHGWRMPLFFLISGFFTAMLWKKRGLRALLRHRFQRIFVPLLLAMLTVIPVMWVLHHYVSLHPSAAASGADAAEVDAAEQAASPAAALRGSDAVAAAALGDAEGLKQYIDEGGDLLVTDDQGSTLLHIACFFGRDEIVEVLLEADARWDVKNNDGALPVDLLKVDWGTTAFIAQLVQVPVNEQEVVAGRNRIAEIAGIQLGNDAGATTGSEPSFGGLQWLLFYFPLFHHLWFLWFLCWYVVLFALAVPVLQRLPTSGLNPASAVSWRSCLIMIPLTMVPQFFMGRVGESFGPDTSVGLIPIPAVFGYYALFFGYGCVWYCTKGSMPKKSRSWQVELPLALLFLFPAGLGFAGVTGSGARWAFVALQAAYAWVMVSAMIGLFQHFCSNHRGWVRYLSDSSYWLYLVHLPVVVGLQFLLRDLAVPALLKFAVVISVTTGTLLLSYHFLVRPTWIGKLLNGRRYPRLPRPARQEQA